MTENLLLIFDEAMAAHDPGQGHPERPTRLQTIGQMLETLTLPGVRRAKPQAAFRETIARVHDPLYIDIIDGLRGKSARLDPDTAVSPRSIESAYLAAGAAIEAVEALFGSPDDGESARRAFALVRPPGHHAERDRAMGFCLFNNIAIAAAHAVASLGVERVLIVDWDVHHGNGTQHTFENRRDVLAFSSHQWPFYPGTGPISEIGVGEGRGFNVNAPIPAGWGDADHVTLYRRLLVPIADAFAPQLVLVSAGFDSHIDDPLGGMRMTEAGFAALCGMVCEIADRHANGRLALILEGGYSLSGLAKSVRACIEVMAGAPLPEVGDASAQASELIEQICNFHRAHWSI